MLAETIREWEGQQSYIIESVEVCETLCCCCNRLVDFGGVPQFDVITYPCNEPAIGLDCQPTMAECQGGGGWQPLGGGGCAHPFTG